MAARMNDAEAIMWAVESDPFLRTDFTNVTLLESAPDFDQLRTGLERAIDAFPPLRQRVARPPLGLAPPQWADDPDFDLEYHLRRLSLPPPGAPAPWARSPMRWPTGSGREWPPPAGASSWPPACRCRPATTCGTWPSGPAAPPGRWPTRSWCPAAPCRP